MQPPGLSKHSHSELLLTSCLSSPTLYCRLPKARPSITRGGRLTTFTLGQRRVENRQTYACPPLPGFFIPWLSRQKKNLRMLFGGNKLQIPFQMFVSNVFCSVKSVLPGRQSDSFYQTLLSFLLSHIHSIAQEGMGW